MPYTRINITKSQSVTDIVLTKDNQIQLKANPIQLDAYHVFAHMITITQMQDYHKDDNNQKPRDGSQGFDCD
jgi:hypothetical protein